MTAKPDARAKLARDPAAAPTVRPSEISRRGFLKTSGALTVAFCLWGVEAEFDPLLAQFGVGAAAGSPPPNRVDSWLAISADGSVTGYTGKQELGQGIVTAQAQLIAEELCVPFERVKIVAADTADTPDEGYTSGSQSHPTNFNRANLAQAAATARVALVRLASERLQAPISDLTPKDGEIFVQSDPAKKVSYSELLEGRKLDLAVDPSVHRKSAAEWTILGKPIPRIDIPALVYGQFEFVHNVKLPGMLHGKVVRPPCVGATVNSVDESSVAGMPGIVKVVVRKNFAGVVAERPWQAIQAADKLKVSWNSGEALPKQADYYDYLRRQTPVRDTLFVDSGNVEQNLSARTSIVKATYRHPFQMHGSMGSSCAVAHVADDKATIWSSSQGVWFLKSSSAILLGMNPQDVRVIFTRGSGCYGHNGADTVSYDAALLSQAVGKPVRVQLARKDEMAWENYGYAYVLEERAALDGEGNIVAWDHETWSPVLGNRPGASTPGNVITGMLAGFEPEPFRPQSPAPAPRKYNNGSNAIPSYVTGCIDGQCSGTGSVKSAF